MATEDVGELLWQVASAEMVAVDARLKAEAAEEADRLECLALDLREQRRAIREGGW